MANVQHADLTDPYLHEPIGIAAASGNTVYTADGAGSGTWQKVDSDMLDTASINTFIEDGITANSFDVTANYWVSGYFTDIDTAGFILVPVLRNSTFVRARIVLANAITAANNTLTFTNTGVGSMGTQVLTFAGSAEGTGFTFTPAGNTTITAPNYIKIETDGLSSTACRVWILCEFEAILNA
jgi:hypothetical protein